MNEWNQLLSILLPSIVCVKQIEKIYGEEKSTKKIIERYLESILCVNLIAYMITIFIFKKPFFIFTNLFTVKYILLSVIIAYLLPIVWKIVKDWIEIDIKVEKNEK